MSSGELYVFEVGLNGVSAKELNPDVPRTSDEVVADAPRCIEAGASIVHNHNIEPLWDPPSCIHDAAP
jgi:uncharacterized protein (DUF849 family)